MGKEITCLLVYCIYHVTAYEKNHLNKDNVTYRKDDVMEFDNFPFTQTPLHPYTKGPPNVAFLIIDVQVGVMLFYLLHKHCAVSPLVHFSQASLSHWQIVKMATHMEFPIWYPLADFYFSVHMGGHFTSRILRLLFERHTLLIVWSANFLNETAQVKCRQCVNHFILSLSGNSHCIKLMHFSLSASLHTGQDMEK